MTVPATTGQLRDNIHEMEIGDFIAMCINPDYEFGTGGKTECPIIGVPHNASVGNYFWYMIKVDKGLLISDRVWIHTFAWNVINNNKCIEGIFIPALNGYIRSLTGGVGYVGVNGNLSMTQIDLSYGAFPVNNEYDTYIKRSDLDGKITPDDDNVWHHKHIQTVVQDTPVAGTHVSIGGQTKIVTTSLRVLRGYDNRMDSTFKDFSTATTNEGWSTTGFRPVFEYKE
ncbi:hypothetical protein D3P07_00670 [Paenibacillus sp. 1011MAR3C5]|uniref:hypothetical protein n=1 Tax=Paenibacillus sp. 1011MAR3C5 TaxID=1675787 RepID=UPI000E6CC29C|nr:hypothetical protein [Paenibacillus sp. 1011MAR3C5]RJE90657.1 hypothetical protein D3P07_00670 [Paenibacillus sp. 1011MAR3C5]